MNLVLVGIQSLLHSPNVGFRGFQSVTCLGEPCAKLAVLALQFLHAHFQGLQAMFHVGHWMPPKMLLPLEELLVHVSQDLA